MELLLGIGEAMDKSPYVDCPEEGCFYSLQDGSLARHPHGPDLFLRTDTIQIDDVDEHERPRLRRIARMLAESERIARLASPFVVYVPRAAAAITIPAKSGIVGVPAPGEERVSVHYQVVMPGTSNLPRYADRVFHAQYRLVDDAATSARMDLPVNDLIEVGTFDPPSGTVTPVDPDGEVALAAWLECEEIDPVELCRSRGGS